MKKRNPKARGYIRICPACSVTVDPVFYGWHKMKCSSVVESLNTSNQRRPLDVMSVVSPFPENHVPSSSQMDGAQKYAISGDDSQSEPEELVTLRQDIKTQLKAVDEQVKHILQSNVVLSVNNSKNEDLHDLERHESLSNAQERASIENDNAAIVSEGNLQNNGRMMSGICIPSLDAEGEAMSNCMPRISTPSLDTDGEVLNNHGISIIPKLVADTEAMNPGMSGSSNLEVDAEDTNHAISRFPGFDSEAEVVSLGLDSQRVAQETYSKGIEMSNYQIDVPVASTLPSQQTENLFVLNGVIQVLVKREQESETKAPDMGECPRNRIGEDNSNISAASISLSLLDQDREARALDMTERLIIGREKNNHVSAASTLPSQKVEISLASNENFNLHDKVELETETHVSAASTLPSHQTEKLDIHAKVEPETEMHDIDMAGSPADGIREEGFTIETLRAKLRDKDNIVETLRSELAEKNAMAESLKSELIVKNELLECLRMEIAEKNNTAEALQAELSQKQESFHNMRLELKEKEESVQKLGSELTAMHEVVEKLRIELSQKNNTIDSTSTPNEAEQVKRSLENNRQSTELDFHNAQTNPNHMSQLSQEGRTTAGVYFEKIIDLDRIVDLACGEEQFSDKFLSQIDELVVASTPQEQQGDLFRSTNNSTNSKADAAVPGNTSVKCTFLSLEDQEIPKEVQQQNYVDHKVSEISNGLAVELRAPVGNTDENINHNLETNLMLEASLDETTALGARKLKRRTCQTVVSLDSESDLDGSIPNTSGVATGSRRGKRLRTLSFRKNNGNTLELRDDIISTPVDWVMDIEEPETPRSARKNMSTQEGLQNKSKGKSVRAQRRLFVDSESSSASLDRIPNEEDDVASQNNGGNDSRCAKRRRLRTLSSWKTRQCHDQKSVSCNKSSTSEQDDICDKRTSRRSTRTQRRLVIDTSVSGSENADEDNDSARHKVSSKINIVTSTTDSRSQENHNTRHPTNRTVNLASDSEDGGSDTNSYEEDSLDGFIVEDSDEVSGSSGGDGMSITSEPSEAEPWVSVKRTQNLRVKNYAWQHEGQMLSSLDSDNELCLRAVCALNRRQTEDEQQSKASMYSNKQGFDKPNAARATSIAEFLTNGDPFGPTKKSVEDLEKHDPNALKYCKMLSFKHSRQLFDIYQNEEDPYFPCG